MSIGFVSKGESGNNWELFHPLGNLCLQISNTATLHQVNCDSENKFMSDQCLFFMMKASSVDDLIFLFQKQFFVSDIILKSPINNPQH